MDTVVLSDDKSATVQFSSEAMCGMLESDGHEVERFLARMREDEELELENESRRNAAQ